MHTYEMCKIRGLLIERHCGDGKTAITLRSKYFWPSKWFIILVSICSNLILSLTKGLGMHKSHKLVECLEVVRTFHYLIHFIWKWNQHLNCGNFKNMLKMFLKKISSFVLNLWNAFWILNSKQIWERMRYMLRKT